MRGTGVVGRCARTAAVLVALVAVGGCSIAGGGGDPREQLAQRPSFEEAEQGYLALLSDLKGVIDERSPDLQWQADGPGERSMGGCGSPFDRVKGAKNANYSLGRGAKGAVSDEQWDPTVQALMDPLKARGFTQVTVLQDQPGAHEIAVGDPATGARVTFGTKKGTILTLYGACFLQEAALSSTPAS